MGGGLLQLVAYGAQDAYISGNPQITFFKVEISSVGLLSVAIISA